MAKLKQPLKSSFDKIEDDLKEVNKGLNQYQKALKDRFKGSALPSGGNEVLQERRELVDRAIAMHLLREGKFGVAETYWSEVNQARHGKEAAAAIDGMVVDGMHQERSTSSNTASATRNWMQDLAHPDAMQADEKDEGEGEEDGELVRGQLQEKFTHMYLILDALRNQHNLGPAIEWARAHSAELEARGSNLEFELSRLKFVELYTSCSSRDPNLFSGPISALDYARKTFPTFSSRYSRETSTLLGSLAFSPALSESPYKPLFYNDAATYADVSNTFTKEFCSMLGLSSTSPLYLACTAGSIALPTLEKVERVMAASRGQWTSVNELPVETPLPPGYQFHSIFVCPVSKEQATDANPPMMMPCGHVIAKESLDMHSKGKNNKMKCPYCPSESNPREAKRVYI